MSMTGAPWEQPPQQPDYRRAVKTAPAPQRGPRDIDGGEIFNQAFSVISANIIPFGVLTIGFFAIETLVIPFFSGMLVSPFQSSNSSIGFLLDLFVDLPPYLVASLLLAALAHGTFQALAGQHVSVRDSTLRGFVRIRAVAGIAVIAWAAAFLIKLIFTFFSPILIDALWLAIPATTILNALAATILWVAIPAAIIEGGGGFDSLFRSLELITGYRWKFFLIAVIFAMMDQALRYISILFLAPVDSLVFLLVINLALAAAIVMLNAVVSAISYQKLRAVKEGIGVDEIAAVSD